MALPYSPATTALLVVDPYNDFMSEGGKLYDLTKKTADSVGFYDNMRSLLPAVRAAGLPVVVVPHHRARPDDFDKWTNVNPFQQMSKTTKGFEAGTWGGEFNQEFGPQPGDIVVHEHWAQNGFANTDLDAQLRQLVIQNIVVVGFVANSCVEATARTGMELGFHVTLLSDATAAFDQAGMDAARVNATMYAHASLTTAEFVAALPEAAAGAVA
ncbi:isochorismatase family cysteine hydrolase [Williamsia sp. M5A3_1d]